MEEKLFVHIHYNLPMLEHQLLHIFHPHEWQNIL